MPRIGAILTGLCIAIIAASVSLLLYVHAAFSVGESVAAGLGTALIMTVMHINAAGGRERRQTKLELDHLYQVNDTLTQELDELRRQMDELAAMSGDLQIVNRNVEARMLKAVEARIEQHIGEIRETMLDEVRQIETVVKEVAEDVAAQHRRQTPAADAPQEHGAARVAPDTPLGHLDDDTVLGMVRRAIEDNRVEVYFQPVVTLPQRKVRYYEALTRLRADDGDLIMPADYLRVAEPAGIMPLVDNLLLFRTVQVVRRLTARNRQVGIFCNISAHSLVDPDFFPQFLEFLERNALLAGSIFFEFSQEVMDAAGPIEVESLASLQEQGFRFSLDKVTSLDLNAQLLRDRGFRFVKVEAERLLGAAEGSGAQIHPADLSKLLARFGIELIAEKIEKEGSVVNLLDFEVALAQGYLFGPPRPVRGDFGEDLPELKRVRRAG